MMTKQIVPKRTQAILSLSDGLQVQNHELVQSEAFTEFLALQNSLQQQIDDGWTALQQLMEAQGVKKIKGDWGYITLTERENLKEIAPLPPRFYKKVLDTSKVRAYRMMKGELPEGVTRTTTIYLSKKVNA